MEWRDEIVVKNPSKLDQAMRLGQKGRLLVATDLDGTVVPLKDDPDHPSPDGVANVELINSGLSGNECAVASLRQMSGLLSKRFASDVLLVASNGRKWRNHDGLIEEHPDAARSNAAVGRAIPVAARRLREAGFVLPDKLTVFDTDFDGYGFALYYRGLKDKIKEYEAHLKTPPAADENRSAISAELNNMSRVLADIRHRVPQIFAELEPGELVVEKGIGMYRLMGAGFTKEQAIIEQWFRSQQHREGNGMPALAAAAYFGDDVDTDDAGWRAVRWLENERLAQVGLAVGTDNPRLSTKDRAKLHQQVDVVLPSVAAFGPLLHELTTGSSRAITADESRGWR
jgi:hypothetical protein